MSNIKIGDMVRCIEPSAYLMFGKDYEVKGLRTDHGCLYLTITNETECTMDYLAWRFELVEEK